SVTSVVYSPDGKFLVDSAVGEYLPYHGIATYTTTLESWNTVTGKLANSSGPWGRSCNTLAFSADGHTIASGFGSPVGAELLTWNFPNLGMGSVLQTAALSVNSVTFAPDGKSLVDGGRGLAGGLVESWSTHTGDLQVANDLPYAGSYPITLSSNGRWLVTVGQTVELLNASNGLHANDIKTAIDDGIQFVVLAADNQVAIGGYSTQYGKGPSTHVELRDIRTGTSRGNIATAANLIYAMVSSKDGRMLAVTGSPSSANMSVVEVWDVATKSKISSIEFPSLWVRSLAFAPDGKSVAIGGNSGPPNRGSEVEIWNLASGTLVSLASNCYQVRSLAFSPDGSRLAVGGSDYNNDGVTEEWNVPNGALVRSLKLGLGSPIVQTLVYSPTRPVLFAATSNGLQVFDSVTGNLIHAYLVGGISDMAIWPDGSRLAISTTNGATMVVDAPNEVR
ncbi:MAG: hypothetical protein P4L46_00425, partial [Fimbriimonas sp.]|nr:hypothetical protein [Fimbriimonas sp.]